MGIVYTGNIYALSVTPDYLTFIDQHSDPHLLKIGQHSDSVVIGGHSSHLLAATPPSAPTGRRATSARRRPSYISDAAQRQRIGQIEDARQHAEYHDVLQQEADLTAGHGILRVTGLIAVSAQDPDELERAVAAIEQAAIQASCETRRLWGQQAQAFSAAALPLCRTV